MIYRIVSAPAGLLVGRALISMAATSIAAVLATSVAFAQAPPPAAAPAKPAPAKPAPAKPPAAKPAPAKPADAAPAQPQPGAQAPAGDQQMPQLMYSQWVKFCIKPDDPNAKQVCLTGIDGRIESGMPVVAVVVIEPEGEPKKLLRITLPVGMHLAHGSRVIIDQNPPLTAPYVACFNNGCMSDYDLTADTLAKLKKGQGILVQGINYNGGAISIPVPLTDFAKVYDGPPTDPKVLEERQKKLEEELQKKGEELQKKANEARQKLESQTPPAAK
jgi:invasion protein IalB